MKLDATKETALEKLIWIGIQGHVPQDFSLKLRGKSTLSILSTEGIEDVQGHVLQDFSLKLRGKSTLSILSTEGIEDVYNYHRGQCKWWILYRNK